MSVYLRLFVAHLPAFIIGLTVVDLLWPRRGPQDFLLKLFLAPGLGWGISSALFFFWCLAFSPFSYAYAGVEWALALGFAGLDLLLSRAEWRAWAAFDWPGMRVLAAGIVFFFGAFLLWQRADVQPNGNFDAYAIWNLRARFIFLSEPQTWTAAFSPELSWWVHADYPLLWPLTLLRGYLSQGRVLTQAGVLQTVVFGCASLGLMMSGLYKTRPGWQASLGGLALLGMPWFVQFSAFQQADVPLVYYSLAGLLLTLLALRTPHPGLSVLAGLAAGCAAWTKNDGIAFLLAAGAVVSFSFLGAKRKSRAKDLLAFGLGLLLPLAALFVFKAVLAPPGDLIGTQGALEIMSKLANPQRYAVIFRALLGSVPSLGGLPWPALAAVLFYLLLAGGAPGQKGGRLFAVPVISLLVYCAVYLVTPQPLEWHLGYSLDRLIFHLLVPALFLSLCLVRSPEELFASLRSSRHVSGKQKSS